MRKDEFLQTLRRALNGNVPPRVVEDNVQYYNDYISEEVRKGRSEEEVIDEIGDPRLIARTIEDTTDGAGEGEFVDGGDGYQQSSARQTRGYGEYDQSTADSRQKSSIHYIDLSKWYWRALAVVAVFAVIYLVFMVIGGVLTLIAPLIGPLFLIWLVVTLFKNRNSR